MNGNDNRPPFHPSKSQASMPENTPEDYQAISGKSSTTIATQTETDTMTGTSNDMATNTALSTIAKAKHHSYANSAGNNNNAVSNDDYSSNNNYFAERNSKNNAQNTLKNSIPETSHDSNEANATNSNPPSSLAASPDNERQTLLLMLLAQVCSLHDATPRTFVVHVLALFERGILGEESIRFLFELGLVPGGYASNHHVGEGAGKECEDIIHGNNRDERPIMSNLQRTQQRQQHRQGKQANISTKNESHANSHNFQCSNCTMGAIVPYCPRTNHVLSRFLTNTSSSASVASSLSSYRSNVNRKSARTNVELNVENTDNSRSNATNVKSASDGNGNNIHQEEQSMLNHRKHQVSAIRQHLERHESLDSSIHDAEKVTAMATMAAAMTNGSENSITVGINVPNNPSEHGPSLSSRRSHHKINSQPIQRGNSSIKRQSTLTSVEESFENNNSNSPGVANGSSNSTMQYPRFQNQQLALTTKHQPHQPHQHPQQTPKAMPPSHPNPFSTTTQTPTSWSVESHPLSLSRYQREFYQISLLATGSFGSVYHAIHKLEHRPYAVKKVTFSTTGYYADALSLVIREVRCLAQLDHPNCVRYYTSWLEPSWMTGGTSGGDVSGGFGGSKGGYDDSHFNNSYSEEEEDDDVEDVTGQRRESYATPFGNKGQNPKLLTDIERVVNDIQNVDEIPESVKQLEALLYGSDDGYDPFAMNGTNRKGASKMGHIEAVDTGFDWGTDYSTGFSFNRGDEVLDSKQDAYGWGNLPSHKTNRSSVSSMGSNEDYGEDSDVSEWTQDLSFHGGRGKIQHSSHWNPSYSSSHNIHVDKATELVKATPMNNHNHNCRPSRNGEKRITPPIPTAPSTYKYQICLFIQMQLCHPSSLADWIKERNSNCESFDAEERQARARVAFEIFRQIVNGLAHVHSKGIIHRDLKPANIFASDDGSWRIGDFGLSKMIQNANNNNNVGAGERDLTHPTISSSVIIFPTQQSNTALQPAPWNVNDVHTKGVGTASYAAPEQISQKHYGPKADIFSLGLILLELFSNFTSDHERAKAFHDCRYRGELPPWMKRTYPEVSALVLACTQQDWRLRPSASDIQAAALFRERGNGVEMYRAELRSLKMEMLKKDDVIQMQKEQLEEKDSLIKNLKLQLRMAESGHGANSSVGAEKYHYNHPVDECSTSDDDDNDY